MDRQDFAMLRALDITPETSSIRSCSNALDAFTSVLISVVITLLMNDCD